ncbi:MAG: GNAT family N-acetyltransferase [Polyangiaceae bacterium]
MAFELQPHLSDALVTLDPLRPEDFEALYAVASDPLIWEQHPSRTRYQRDVFENYFQGALASGGAFRISETRTGEPMGSSRYYDLDEVKSEVAIGYTFIARKFWGGAYNRALKTLMLDHAFRFVERAIFHVGRDNKRSRAAMEKLGAILVGEQDIAYYGEKSNPNVVYEISRAAFRGPAR